MRRPVPEAHHRQVLPSERPGFPVFMSVSQNPRSAIKCFHQHDRRCQWIVMVSTDRQLLVFWTWTRQWVGASAITLTAGFQLFLSSRLIDWSFFPSTDLELFFLQAMGCCTGAVSLTFACWRNASGSGQTPREDCVIVQCTVYTLQCTVYTVQCTV